jgi:hypothetical protein
LTALNSLRSYYNSGAHVNSGYANDYGHLYAPYTLADFNAGGIENADNISQVNALIREIIEERYVTLTGQLEVFTDVRRTGNLLKLPIKSGYTIFPQRLLYAQAEQNANTANVPKDAVTLTDPTPVNKTPY